MINIRFRQHFAMGPGMRRVAHTTGIRLLVVAAFGGSACTPEPPPHTVVEFMENPRLLEATMVRCAENRAELKYTTECLNAREAGDRLAAAEEAEQRAALEAQSERKREALRRAQQDAAEARARAEEAERLRREAEYLSQFGEVSEEPVVLEDGQLRPLEGAPPASGQATNADEDPASMPVDPPPGEPSAQPASDLAEIREELQRRQGGSEPATDGEQR